MTGQWSDGPYWTPTCDRCGEEPRNCECEQTDSDLARPNEDLTELRPEPEQTTFQDIFGIAPDATGDLSSEDFVRELRSGW